VRCSLSSSGGEGQGEEARPPRAPGTGLSTFPDIPGTVRVAERVSTNDAIENLRIMEQLQRWLGTNVQEALALEVSLLKLRL